MIRTEMRILLSAGAGDVPDPTPTFVQLLMDGENPCVVGGNSVVRRNIKVPPLWDHNLFKVKQ